MQLEQVLELGPANLPAAHWVAMPPVQKDPEGQGLQVLAPARENVVPVQLAQLEAPAAENVPAKQVQHVVDIAHENDPALH